MDTSSYHKMKKAEIINAIAGDFSSFFQSRNYKVNRTFKQVLAHQKNSAAELWLPEAEERYYGTFAMFRLTVDIESEEEFLIILNRDPGFGRDIDNGPFYFKLVRKSKKVWGNKSDYPRFRDFKELLNAAIKENSSLENEQSRYGIINPEILQDFEEYSSFIKKMP